MTHGSLFTGIGGFDLAAEWMGWDNIFQCEIDPYCREVLKKHWPKKKLYGDITKTNFTVHRKRIDVLSGGFPCQPFSQAGNRKGISDKRYKWPSMRRAIRQIRPRWVVPENVRGFTNWNAGMVFDQVQTDLENEGYEVTPFLLPSCGTNAPHERQRIFLIAHSKEIARIISKTAKKQKENFNAFGPCSTWPTSDPYTSRLQKPSRKEQHSLSATYAAQPRGKFGRTYPKGNEWRNFPTQSPVCGGNDGLSNRVDAISALGNAVNPLLIFRIFVAIEKFEALIKQYQ